MEETTVSVKAIIFTTESPFDALRLLRADGGHGENRDWGNRGSYKDGVFTTELTENTEKIGNLGGT